MTINMDNKMPQSLDNPLGTHASWQELQKHIFTLQKSGIKIQDLFSNDLSNEDRAKLFSREAVGILLDFSKQLLTSETVDLLMSLAKEAGVREMTTKMFNGERINTTENRPVLHTALRNMDPLAQIFVDEYDVLPDVRSVLVQMRRFANSIHSGQFTCSTGKTVRHVVNIGIGGSYLGPKMVCEALKFYAKTDIKVHFLTSVDGMHLVDILNNVDPETTLFLVASKTFTTQETMLNAKLAKVWLLNKLAPFGISESDVLLKHFVALSVNSEQVARFGISPDHMFPFWDWVGGRYSLWGSVGLSIMLYIGADMFDELLHGAYEMDEHFRNAKLTDSLPVLLALVGVWNCNFLNAETHVMLPYCQSLCHFPAWLQQLDMESNGKSVDLEGRSIQYTTGPVLYGEIGTNGQHSFHQLLHQGTRKFSVDFLTPVNGQNHDSSAQQLLHTVMLSNCFAQSEALMKGCIKSVPHKQFEGNKGSNTILFQHLNPRTLGSLLALYEHKVFVQGVIWKINSFDQFGVELGKQMATRIQEQLDFLHNKIVSDHDSSTNQLINYCKAHFNIPSDVTT
jgi:glucose-6-phosphate isomerase